MTMYPITSIVSEHPIPTGDAVFGDRLALSVAEVAEALGVSRSLVSRECLSRRLHSIKVGKRRLIPVSSIYDWLSDS